jgi:hypothetical protein
LMSKTTTSTMNHHTDLSFEVNTHFTRSKTIVDFIYNLNFSIMITRT